MRQALCFIYGLNLGTTMTGWLVSLLGFKFDIQVSGVAVMKGIFDINFW
jgi:Na+/phosphate symporter